MMDLETGGKLCIISTNILDYYIDKMKREYVLNHVCKFCLDHSMLRIISQLLILHLDELESFKHI